MIRKSREIQKEKQQLATCLLPINAYNMSTTTTLKTHTAALPPSFNKSGCSGGVSCGKTNPAAAAMSTLAADLCKAVTTKRATPPTEAAVVVNSIIYSKPSFCSIVVDIGDTTDNPITNATGTATTSDKFSRINNPALPPSPQTAGNDGVFPLPTMDNQNDAHVYMMCTTMNGAIHHHISEMCDNLIAMGLFGMEANSEHDDDSFIEFAYDDADDENDIVFQHTDDEDDDDDDDEDEGCDSDDDNDVEEYETDDEDAYPYAGQDVTDFAKCPTFTIAPTTYNCDKKKKKVRFNTKPTVHVMRTWDYAYRAARKGEWEMYARDRDRFKMRIHRTAYMLNPILDREHRLKVYEQRFACLYAEQENEKVKATPPQPKKTNQNQKHRKKRRKRRRPNF